MATDKSSVLLYCDLIHTVEKLKDVDAGKLFKHFLRYINDQDPEPPNNLIQIVFEPIKQNLKRDLKKWEKIKGNRSEAGKISAEKRKQQNSTKSTSVESVEQTSTKSTVSVNDNVSVTVNDNVNVKVIKKEQEEVYRKFSHLSLSIKEFEKLISEGWSKEQVDSILDSIENYAKNKKYTVLITTARNWLKRDHKPNKVDLILNSYSNYIQNIGNEPTNNTGTNN